MPPRKSISSRAEPGSRRGPRSKNQGASSEGATEERPKLPSDDDEHEHTEAWTAPPGRMSREQPTYKTGSEYEAVDDEAVDEEAEGDEFLGEDALPASFSKERDIYGEDDPIPEDEEFSPVDDGLSPPREKTEVGRPSRKTGETRVAPIDELEQEDERPDSPDATRAGPPVKLEIISGPDTGKVKSFKGVRMVIGRTAGCDWKLSDPSASRRHCELVVGDAGVLLRDLGSGNGTKVNGQKVTEHKLQHGDEISLGKTVFRFIDEMAAFKKARDEAEAKEKAEAEAKAAEAKASESKGASEAQAGQGKPDDGPQVRAKDEVDPNDPRLSARTDASQQARSPNATELRPVYNAARRKDAKGSPLEMWSALQPNQQRAVLIGVGSLLLLLLIFSFAAFRKPPPPSVDPKVEHAAERMQQARNAFRDGKWDEAMDLAQTAEKLVPGTDSDGLVKRAQAESDAEKQLSVARKALDAGDFDTAKVELARVSFVSPKGNEEKAAFARELDDKYLVYLKGQADSAIEAKDLANAKALVSKMPFSEQRNYSQKLIKLEADLENDAREQAKQEKQSEKDKKRRAVAARQAYVEQAFESVSRKFAAGDFARAALDCDRVADAHKGDGPIKDRATELKRLIPQFARSYEDGQKKFKAGSMEAAAHSLKKARDVYVQIGFEGALGNTLDEEVASTAMYAANQAYAREDYAIAAMYFREAAKLNPSDEQAKDGIVKVNKRAEELYLQAYMIRDREPKEAIAKLKVVLQILDDSAPFNKKAKDLLAQLQ